MYLKKSKNSKTGRTYLTIASGYHDKKLGYTKTVIVQSLGYLDVLEKEYDDPIAHFETQIKKMNEEQRSERLSKPFSINLDEEIDDNSQNFKNFGYAAASKIYHELELDKFFLNKYRGRKISEYTINNIVKLLVFGRLLFPASKKATYDKRELFFENTDYSLDEVYNGLSHINKYRDEIQKYVYDHIRTDYGDNTETVYYDLTNYYFEIDGQDDLRKKGVSKEHRPDPIVQMGLLMDNIGMPMGYRLFAGNTNDCQTILPFTRDIIREYNLNKMIIVADKGINTGDNIYRISNRGDGYVMSLSIRKSEQEIKEYVLDQKGYSWTGKDYKKKSKLHPRKIWVTIGTNKDGTPKKKQIRIDERIVIFYSEKYAKRLKAQRQPAIDKATDLIGNVAKYNKKNCYGASKYVKHLVFNKETGEIIEAKSQLSLDLEKIQEEEKYDGYYAIVTSEYKKTADEIIDIYRGLWKIEETFKITKSDLEARPVHLSREDRIQAHFLICYLALVIARILQHRLNNKYSVGQILESLAKISCTHFEENYYVFNYKNDITKDLKTALGIDFTKKYMRLKDIKKVLSDVKKT
jgi:transposase